jgi:glucosamine-6-phosphate deaminase
MERFRSQWGKPELVAELTASGFVPGPTFPETSGLTFVMLDEFFPMSSTHRNSFCNYISTFYLPPLRIPAEQVLNFDLINQGVITEEEITLLNGHNVDLTLLERDAVDAGEAERKAVLVKVQAFCDQFEKRVRDLGGIGFFLGGIGPDGHIAFNQEGSSHDSTTRLVNFNYPTAAAAYESTLIMHIYDIVQFVLIRAGEFV